VLFCPEQGSVGDAAASSIDLIDQACDVDALCEQLLVSLLGLCCHRNLEG